MIKIILDTLYRLVSKGGLAPYLDEFGRKLTLFLHDKKIDSPYVYSAIVAGLTAVATFVTVLFGLEMIEVDKWFVLLGDLAVMFINGVLNAKTYPELKRLGEIE